MCYVITVFIDVCHVALLGFLVLLRVSLGRARASCNNIHAIMCVQVTETLPDPATLLVCTRVWLSMCQLSLCLFNWMSVWMSGCLYLHLCMRNLCVRIHVSVFMHAFMRP